MSFQKWLQRRESGLPPYIGDRDRIIKQIYKSIEPFYLWDDFIRMPDNTSEYGAIFNLEFSPEGNVLVAACEKKSIVIFDAISTKQKHKITGAHTDNVNCVKFLDDRMFATCSDDTTVALWDLRFLKSKVRSLHGHSNWVKNIEYSHKDGLLVTSGFDGSIFTWDINSHTEQGLIYQKVFHTSGLMRCRISPDGNKLVICTTGGYLMIIHDLDLTTLHKDLCGFRPTIYRLMQMGHQYIPQAAKFGHVFSKKQKQNRVELVTDFPDENDAEVILALQIHPHGHSFLSRNISYDELTEWSCIHDFNDEPDDITARMGSIAMKRKRKHFCQSDDEAIGRFHHDSDYDDDLSIEDDVLFGINRRRRIRDVQFADRGVSLPSYTSTPVTPAQPASRRETFVPDIWAAEVTVQERAIRQIRGRNSNFVTGYNFVYAISSGVLPTAMVSSANPSAIRQSSSTYERLTDYYNPTAPDHGDPLRYTPVGVYSPTFGQPSYPTSPRPQPESPVYAPRSPEPHPVSPTYNPNSPRYSPRSPVSPFRPTSPIFPSLIDDSTSGGESLTIFERIRTGSFFPPPRKSLARPIFENAKKLMYYIKESNKGKGFIKEPSFSSDGRIICSPYDTGVRLLALSGNCSEYPRHHNDVVKRKPQHLVEVKTINSQSDIVLSTKFSPRAPLLVTGCRGGTIVWHQPNL